MSKGISTKRRFVFTKRELESLSTGGREFPVGKRLTTNTLVDFWLTTGTAQNEEWAPEDLMVVELVTT